MTAEQTSRITSFTAAQKLSMARQRADAGVTSIDCVTTVVDCFLG